MEKNMKNKWQVRRETLKATTNIIDPMITRKRSRRGSNGAIIVGLLFMCCCMIIPTALAFISPSQNCDVLSIESSNTRRIHNNNLKKNPAVARSFPSSSSSSSLSTIIPSTTVRTKSSSTTSTALFGIKGFRSWFQEQFPNAVRHVDVDTYQDKFDHVLVDMNQILHVILRRSRNQEQVTKTLMFELDLLVSRCNPTQSLVLAIDGSPAAAKLATQRKRRFAILKNTQFKLKHSDKLRMTKRQRARRKRNYKAELQSLQLTPGTACMQNMEAVLLYWAWQRLQTQGKPHSKLLPKVRIYISSSSVPGEGEIKLLEWINNYRGHLSTKPGQSIALIGGDADLLLEAMVIPPSWTHNVFVLRPEEADNNNKSKAKMKAKKPKPAEKSTKSSKNGSSSSSSNNNNKWSGRKDNIMHCTSLWEMTLSLDDYCRKNISTKYYDPEHNPNDQNLLLQIRTDMVLLFMLNGNDYLPRVVAVGFRGVLRTYLTLLEQWIDTKQTTQNIGLVDPNTLQFNSDFCSDFFHILGRDAPTEQERLRSAMQTKRKTYHSIVNDMSAIGFLPAPVKFEIVDNDGTNEQVVKVEDDTHAQIEEDDDEEEEEDDDYDDDDADDDTVDDGEEFDNDDYDDDEDDDLDSDDSLSEENNDIASNDEESEDELDMMQLSLGKINSNDYHEYQISVNAGSSNSKTTAKNSLAKIVLNEFKLLEFVESEGDMTKLDYEWEITVPAAANLDRYLGGLLWTLQTYQDGVCPSYSYNYGKCMAPTGRTIAAYFDQAIHDKRDVGAEELLQNFEPGGSISAGVACLAALPVSVKDLVPKPYSLIADATVEDFYSQCMDPVDNFFYFKKFEELVDAEVKRMTKDGLNSENTKDDDIDASPGRHIILGDHYWTVLKRGKEVMEHPFRPPSPPTENFSKLRPNSRITASRIISMDRPPPRASNTKNATKADERPSKTRYPRKFWVKNMIDIDHLNFGSLITGSESSSVSQIPYKIAFGSSPDMYGGSRQANDKTSFKLLNSSPVDVLYKQSTVDSNDQLAEIAISTPLHTPILNPESQSALVILKQLCDIRLVGCYTFDDSPNHEITLTIAKPDEINVILPVEKLTFTLIKENSQTEQSVKQCLASLALDSMMNSGGMMKDEKQPRVRWYDLTFQGTKDFLELHHSGTAVAKKSSNVDTNLENQSALVILKQLCDIGLVQCYEFNEVPGSSDHPEKTSLFLYKQGSSSPESSSEEEVVPFLSFERNRITESKKWVRQHLVSLALDEMILNGTANDNKGGDDNLTKIHWYDLTFQGIKERICLHQ